MRCGLCSLLTHFMECRFGKKQHWRTIAGQKDERSCVGQRAACRWGHHWTVVCAVDGALVAIVGHLCKGAKGKHTLEGPYIGQPAGILECQDARAIAAGGRSHRVARQHRHGRRPRKGHLDMASLHTMRLWALQDCALPLRMQWTIRCIQCVCGHCNIVLHCCICNGQSVDKQCQN